VKEFLICQLMEIMIKLVLIILNMKVCTRVDDKESKTLMDLEMV